MQLASHAHGSTRSDERAYSLGPEQQAFVQTASAVALQVEADVAIAERLERADDRRRELGIERARHLVPRDLDAGNVVVVPDAEDAKSEAAKRLFGLFDRAQLFVGHVMQVRNSRRQTSRRGFVPGREPGAARELADLGFAQLDFVERTAHAELARGLPAGTIIAAVVSVVAVD